jgi:SAM-dependent methyltransferase
MNDLNLGLQPLCNRFLEKDSSDEFVHNMHLVQDRNTGLVGIKTPALAEEMQTKYKWLSETEPINHFKSVAKTIEKLSGLNGKSRILSFSYRDKPLSNELLKSGFENIVNTQRNIPEFVGVAKIQKQLCDNSFIENIINKYGAFDLLLINRIIHHVHDLEIFFSSINNLLDDKGYAVIEVPDCARGFFDLDYNIIFEEHVYYFTSSTLKHLIELNGFEIVSFEIFPYPFENALVAIIKKSDVNKISILLDNVAKEIKLFTKFSQSFPLVKHAIKSFFIDIATKGSILFFGAGHHGISFVNIMGIGQFVDCFIDDKIEKQKYYTPGSSLPIYGSDHLTKDNIAICVVSVSQENEEKVIKKIRFISNNSFEIYSIFPASRYALPIY